MERQFFSGNTIEQALMLAARHHGLDPDRVAYRRREKKHGFLNIRRRVVIEVDPEAPEKLEPERVEPEPPAAAAPSLSGRPAQRGGSGETRPAQRGGSGETRPAQRGGSGETRPAQRGGSGETRPAQRGGSGETALRGGSGETRPALRGGSGETRPALRGGSGETETLRHATADGVLEEWQTISDEFADECEDSESGDQEIAAFEKALAEAADLMGMEIKGSIRRRPAEPREAGSREAEPREAEPREAGPRARDDVIEVELLDGDRDQLVANDGQLLRSIEHLLPRLVRGLLGYGLPCSVDCDGFRAARGRELQELAAGMAEVARRQGETQTMEPMDPADRRVVHLALADDPSVRTESEGDGFMKRVRIQPI